MAAVCGTSIPQRSQRSSHPGMWLSGMCSIFLGLPIDILSRQSSLQSTQRLCCAVFWLSSGTHSGRITRAVLDTCLILFTTLTGRNVSKVAIDCDIKRSSLSFIHAKNIKYYPPPPGEQWRVPLLLELIDVRMGTLQVPGISPEDVEAIINEICCN